VRLILWFILVLCRYVNCSLGSRAKRRDIDPFVKRGKIGRRTNVEAEEGAKHHIASAQRRFQAIADLAREFRTYEIRKSGPSESRNQHLSELNEQLSYLNSLSLSPLTIGVQEQVGFSNLRPDLRQREVENEMHREAEWSRAITEQIRQIESVLTDSSRKQKAENSIALIPMKLKAERLRKEFYALSKVYDSLYLNHLAGSCRSHFW
jgi:hypothetical protein